MESPKLRLFVSRELKWINSTVFKDSFLKTLFLFWERSSLHRRWSFQEIEVLVPAYSLSALWVSVPRLLCMRRLANLTLTPETWALLNVNTTFVQQLTWYPYHSPCSQMARCDHLDGTSLSLHAGKTTVKLNGGDGTRWQPTSQNCQTWFPPVVPWLENQTS